MWGNLKKKENILTSFNNVTLKDYWKIKRSLKKSFKTIPCLSDNRSVVETFDVVLMDSKLPITYYKTKILQIQEDSSNNSKKIIEIIQTVLNIWWLRKSLNFGRITMNLNVNGEWVILDNEPARFFP